MGRWGALTVHRTRHAEIRIQNDAKIVPGALGAPSTTAARSGRPRRLHSAERWFFPAAALYGAVAVPVSLYGMAVGTQPIPGFATPMGHAHELLFGYALAVAAGFLVTRVRTAILMLLFGLWLAARATFLFAPQGLVTAAANIAFAALFAGLVAPKLMQGAKKLRNQAFGPTIVAIALALAAFHFSLLSKRVSVAYGAAQEAVLLFTLLMLFMGGRIIAPAVAAAIERTGGHLEARLQPRIEGGLLVLMAIAVIGAPLPGGRLVAGVALMGAGILAAVRVLRWRIWRCRARPDLLCLGVGYGWLAVGLCLLGASWSIGGVSAASAVHGLTIGALGTLTSTVMVRVRTLRAKRDPAAILMLPVIVVLITLATVLRIGAGSTADGLWMAAACWSAGLILLTITLVRIPQPLTMGG